MYLNDELKGAQIADRLNDEAVPCRGTKWWGSQVYAVLKNEAYTGTAYMFRHRMTEPSRGPKLNPYRHKKKSSNVIRPREDWIAVSVAQIIDSQTWHKAQEQLKHNIYCAHRNNNKHDYLLRGLVLCGLCGSMATGYVSNKSTYYSCAAKRNGNITTKPHDELIQISHPPFDEKVWKGLLGLLSDPNTLMAQLDKRLQARKLPRSLPPDEFDQDLSQLATQEKRILDAYREEVITLQELRAQKDQIATRRKVLEAKKHAALRQADGPGQPEITMAVLGGDVSARFRRAVAKADFATRQRIVNLLVNSVTLYPQRAIVRGNIPLTSRDVLSTPPLKAAFICAKRLAGAGSPKRAPMQIQ